MEMIEVAIDVQEMNAFTGRIFTDVPADGLFLFCIHERIAIFRSPHHVDEQFVKWHLKEVLRIGLAAEKGLKASCKNNRISSPRPKGRGN